MAIAVEMPKPGNSVEECLLAKWMKPAGSDVTAGEVIAEIETDKATFEVTAPAAGKLLAVFWAEGSLVPVFEPICAIGEAGEDVSALSSRKESPAAGSAPVAERAVPTPEVAAAHGIRTNASAYASPRARRYARQHEIGLEMVSGSGPGGRIIERDVREYYHSSPKLSYLARKQAGESSTAPDRGGGIGGLVLAADLLEGGKPLGTVRERIGRRMRDSLTGTAQYTLTTSADATGLLALRGRIKSRHQNPDITIGDMVLFATVQALRRAPSLNAELRDGKLYQHNAVHLGFACDTDRGLLVPVIRNAQSMGLAQIAAAAKALAERAIQGRISPDDLTGGTFTVSNLGSLGIESFTPILNPPQVGILGVNAILVRAMRTERGIELVDRIGLSLTCDHQVIDGAPGARFLAVVCDCIENIGALSGFDV